MSTAPTSALAYHRLALSATRPRWWRPIATIALTLVLFLVAIVVLTIPLVALSLAVPGADGLIERTFESSDLSDPWVAATALLSIALLLPASLLGTRLVADRPVGTLSSVTGRLRRPLLLRCLGAAALLIVPVGLISVTVDGGWRSASISDRTLPLLALALLVVPLQAAAEEYAFRGLLMQAVGAWVRHPAFAIVLPVVPFTLGHEYGALGLVDVAAFGLTAGWLTWRTGGLEAAIGLHVVNNASLTVLDALSLADGDADGTLLGLVTSIAVTCAYAGLVRDWGVTVGAPMPTGSPAASPAISGRVR